MQIGQASQILARWYDNAPPKEKALSIHLFAIKHAHQIQDMPIKDIVIDAGLPESYKTEIRKGINLAKYVEIKNQMATQSVKSELFLEGQLAIQKSIESN